MDDFSYSQRNFEDLLGRINNNIKELENELEMFESAFGIVRENWSGSEYAKAEVKFLEIEKTLKTVLDDQIKQRNYLAGQNDAFASQATGL